jgi:hypothetical protein
MSVIQATKTILDAKGAAHECPTALISDMNALCDWLGLDASKRRLATQGDNSLVDASDKFLALIEAESPEAMTGRETINSVTGAIANVPAYLSGSPHNMRLRRTKPDKAPLCIAITGSCYSEYSDGQRLRRGAATIALLRKLETNGHPVELYLAQGNGGSKTAFMAVRLQSNPLSLAQLAWAMCTMSGLRTLGLNSVTKLGGDGSSGPAPFYDDKGWRDMPEPYRLAFAATLGVDADSLIAIPSGGRIGQRVFNTDKSAAQWVSQVYTQAINRESFQ